MSLTVSTELLKETTSDSLELDRKHVGNGRSDREHAIDVSRLDDAGLQDIMQAAASFKDTKTMRAVESILLARTGAFSKPVPNFKAFHGVLVAFLKHGLIDGWIYAEGDDGKLYPELVTHIRFSNGDTGRGKANPSVYILTASYGHASDGNYNVKFGMCIIADILGIKRGQIEGVVNPDGDLIEKSEVEPGYIKRLAGDYLTRMGIELPDGNLENISV